MAGYNHTPGDPVDAGIEAVTMETSWDYPDPPWDHNDYDYVQYLAGDSLKSVEMTWTDDPAFFPTSITYGLAFLVGVTGNFMVVFALLGDKKARNATSSFLVSLAMGDLMFLLICIPYETMTKLTNMWAGGVALCKLSGYVEMLSAAASILNLTAVSVERYVVIVHPMKTRSWFTVGNTLKIILCVWAVALALASPTLYIMDTSVTGFYNNVSSVVIETCGDSNFHTNTGRIMFAWYQMTVMFLLPVLIMGYCYAVVIRVLWLSTKQLAKMTHGDSDDESKRSLTGNSSGRGVIRAAVKDHSAEVREARKQVIKMLLTIICIFLLCWGPKLILTVMKRHELAILHNSAAFSIGIAIHLMPYIQSAMNPLIYGFMSNNFRRSLRNAFRQRCCCDPFTLCQKQRRIELDMETKSFTINGSSRYSPSRTRATSVTYASEV